MVIIYVFRYLHLCYIFSLWHTHNSTYAYIQFATIYLPMYLMYMFTQKERAIASLASVFLVPFPTIFSQEDNNNNNNTCNCHAMVEFVYQIKLLAVWRKEKIFSFLKLLYISSIICLKLTQLRYKFTFTVEISHRKRRKNVQLYTQKAQMRLGIGFLKEFCLEKDCLP